MITATVPADEMYAQELFDAIGEPVVVLPLETSSELARQLVLYLEPDDWGRGEVGVADSGGAVVAVGRGAAAGGAGHGAGDGVHAHQGLEGRSVSGAHGGVMMEFEFAALEPSMRIRFRSQMDFLPTITGDLLMQLKEVGPVIVEPVKPDPRDNPLAITIELGSVLQLEAVQRIALEWVSEPLGAGETVERIIEVWTPDKKPLGWVMVPVDGMDGPALDPADAGVVS